MMRICKAVLFGLTMVSATFSAQTAVYVAADESRETQLCVSAAMDPAIRFVIKMQESGMSRKVIASRITCNGTNITAFAKEAGNTKNYQRLSRYHRGYVEISDIAKVNLVKPTEAVIQIRGGSIAR